MYRFSLRLLIIIMKKIGFIGYGHMAQSINNTFLRKKIFQKSQIIISEIPKAVEKLKSEKSLAGINIISDNGYVAKNSDILFLCVKPLTAPKVLSEIKNSLSEKQHLVSIAACLELEEIEEFFKGKITRTLPSIISETGYGIIFFTHNSKVSSREKKYLEKVLSSMGSLQEINEEDYKFAVNMTSSAPGIIAYILDAYTSSAVKNSGINRIEASAMIVKTVMGTIKTVYDNNTSFAGLAEKVATQGGITESSLNVLKKKLPEVFDKAIEASIIKNNDVEYLIREEVENLTNAK